MKSLKFAQNPDLGIFILRVSTSAFMLSHGWPKLERVLSGQMQFGDPIGIGPTASLLLVTFAEFICPILIALGIWTRIASIPLAFTMFVAVFVAHGADPFAKKELALLYLFVYVSLLFLGSGKYALLPLFKGKIVEQ